jgi:hypothetical protein
MGAHFSTEPDHFQLLSRDKEGRLSIFTMNQPEALKECSKLPFDMSYNNVRYAFLSTTDKKWHAHVYADSACDITGNEPVGESTLKNKTANTINHSNISNSSYFNLSSEAVNEPKHAIFYDSQNFPQYAAKSSYTSCKPMPFTPEQGKQSIAYDHNGVPMILYTDKECINEYTAEPSADGAYKSDNRTIDSKTYLIPYTEVKTAEYSTPASLTNARYYKSFTNVYPDELMN